MRTARGSSDAAAIVHVYLAASRSATGCSPFRTAARIVAASRWASQWTTVVLTIARES